MLRWKALCGTFSRNGMPAFDHLVPALDAADRVLM